MQQREVENFDKVYPGSNRSLEGRHRQAWRLEHVTHPQNSGLFRRISTSTSDATTEELHQTRASSRHHPNRLTMENERGELVDL